MKRNYIIFTLYFFTILSFSQKKYNVFSAEIGYGFNIPLTPSNGIESKDYIFPRHLDLGIRYMFDEYFGVKLYYANDRFQNVKNKNIGNGYHRLSLEVVYNIEQALDLLDDDFNLFFHAGIGITYAFPEAIKRFKNGGEFTFGLTPYNTKNFERIGNIIFGITPQYRYSDDVALTFDVSYVINTQQQYGYDGEMLYIDRTKVKGSFINFTLGIQLYLGRKRRHADWYNDSRKH